MTITTCPTCGSTVSVYTSDEGTSSFVPVDVAALVAERDQAHAIAEVAQAFEARHRTEVARLQAALRWAGDWIVSDCTAPHFREEDDTPKAEAVRTIWRKNRDKVLTAIDAALTTTPGERRCDCRGDALYTNPACTHDAPTPGEPHEEAQIHVSYETMSDEERAGFVRATGPQPPGLVLPPTPGEDEQK